MRFAVVMVALAALAVNGCAPAAPPQSQAGGQSFARDMSAADRASCTAAGGRVERRGRLGAELCVRPFADAGKACTDSAQCEGKCVAQGNTDVPATAGQCQADDRLFGCYAEIQGGRTASTLCVD